ncbi:hypothetical protein TBLA_0D04910 [Henningerozyma blattae CBS 6284]|uniref:Arrestin C-terminal-like domain-containing protein n=1 Tax=Henningerozyma blattae (strain ATCC 34711 / CBS 6284 / DSM 70876 / NBRC 10599 / NRRL Y-10934 / UCD 77-7) TaxID=1071380 RepID=I2H3N4_HENB6|nr:hypothetical protein TBLA_0D04910 [Tetrapisispora blattae CBS 6284]CCH60986.1 hypothetical protein TBLA_0D04910 [Tetrapisispora blattae CBS 6284]
MSFFSSHRQAEKAPILFDIRFDTSDDNVILLKGSSRESASALLSGKIVLSINEPMQIRNIFMRLFAKLTVNLEVNANTNNTPNTAKRYVKQEKILFDKKLDNIQIDNLVGKQSTNQSVPYSTTNSNNSETTMGWRSRSKSSSIATLTNSNSSPNFTSMNKTSIIKLQKGNYEFPFSYILPGSSFESVNGLPNASINYTLQTIIERGKYSTDLLLNKDIKVIRTLTTDAVELSETVSVNNNWPGKIDYSISVPTKAIAIGSVSSLSIGLVPLVKHLRLGPIKVILLEQYQYSNNSGEIITNDRKVLKFKLKDPLGHIEMAKQSEETGLDPFIFQSKWEVTTNFQVPSSLSRCTQDCTIKKYIKVRHKLKFVISMINEDGHISQLKASLPIVLYISPLIPLTVQSKELREQKYSCTNLTQHSSLSNLSTMSSQNFSGKNSVDSKYPHSVANIRNLDNEEEQNKDDEIIFPSIVSSLDLQNATNTPAPEITSPLNPVVTVGSTNAGSTVSPMGFQYSATSILPVLQEAPKLAQDLPSLMVPPNYEDRIYDRLWGTNCTDHNGAIVENLTLSTPVSPNLTHSPIIESNLFPDGSASNYMADVPEGLTMPNNENINITTNNPFRSEVTQSEPRRTISANTPHTRTDSFRRVGSSTELDINNLPSTPGLMIRPISFNSSSQLSMKDWPVKDMSRVPSYDMAKKNVISSDDLPPAYISSKHKRGHSTNNSSINATPATIASSNHSSSMRRSNSSFLQMGQIKPKKPPISGSSSSTSLTSSIKNALIGDTTTSPPNLSPNLSKNSSFKISNTANKHFAFGMTPVGEKTPTEPATISSSRISSSTNLRTTNSNANITIGDSNSIHTNTASNGTSTTNITIRSNRRSSNRSSSEDKTPRPRPTRSVSTSAFSTSHSFSNVFSILSNVGS